ncbi:hypothetical protein EIKCOROL_01004 [Eikenella corrodens ATCC 23834]|uniref:Uncharacterized protein n=1 Tax=Eikenella corrodens ATCC 23834 TaxID=546274 RepID=C0DUH3_EIKCO|nr:hypothetical protein EIKCOROL_01004 [Eikenella corrodens ATCC 23834]
MVRLPENKTADFTTKPHGLVCRRIYSVALHTQTACGSVVWKPKGYLKLSGSLS